ncbi:hypothetical protein I5M27_03390 [Adhaeribacter sp. BT258]|uniref:Uncharacterized protein n=1 Tax=Adhaeribacter terrigena TaxID=2793070 RepID=A0ABS1BXX1_9BACT|nr:hypothetical protein [Adhaeribacter terrigena]MBK0402013.1 hypothetical protein [Adhaeribacter terrigena]
MKRFLYLIPGLALSVLAVSCQPDIEAPDTNSADLNLTRYVAYGDYITAGFMNGGLSRESQQNAYPAILAKQFALFGAPATFEQPYFSGEGTPMMTLASENGAPAIRNSEEFVKLTLAECTGLPSLNKPYGGDLAKVQNFGVPALKIKQLKTPGLGNSANQNTAGFNPYFERILPASDNRSYLEVAGTSNPTFFTAWFGMSDVISYIMSGAACGTLPEEAEFTTEMNSLLDNLTKRQPNGKAERKGVILNLPSYEDFPIAYAPDLVKIQDDLRKQTGNSNLTIWVKVLKNMNVPSQGVDTVVVVAKDILTPKGRTTIGVQGHGLSKQHPLNSDEVLNYKEIQHLTARMNRYNVKITDIVKNPAFANMVIVADMKQLFGTLRNGVIYNGVKYDLSPVKGGVFSLDNFTLTPRGQAIVANKIIQAMNQEVLPKSPQFSGFGTKIPEVNVNDYPAMGL